MDPLESNVKRRRIIFLSSLIFGNVVAFVLPLAIIFPILDREVNMRSTTVGQNTAVTRGQSTDAISLTTTALAATTTNPTIITTATGLQTTSNELSTLASSTETTQTLEITTTKPCSVTDIAPLSTVTFAPSLNPKPTSLPYDLRAGGSVTLTFTDTSYVVNVWLKVSNVVYVTLFTDGGTDKEAAFNGVEHDYLPSPVSTSEITIKLDGSPADTLSISELIVNVCT